MFSLTPVIFLVHFCRTQCLSFHHYDHTHTHSPFSPPTLIFIYIYIYTYIYMCVDTQSLSLSLTHTFLYIKSVKAHIPSDAVIVSTAKGLHTSTLEMMSALLSRVLGPRRAAFLSGPSFAKVFFHSSTENENTNIGRLLSS